MLKARQDAVDAYRQMEGDAGFQNPTAYESLKSEDFDGLLLPGGHDKGMIEYLESDKLQTLVCHFFTKGKVVGAICHGVVLAARSVKAGTGKSVLHNYKTDGIVEVTRATSLSTDQMEAGGLLPNLSGVNRRG